MLIWGVFSFFLNDSSPVEICSCLKSLSRGRNVTGTHLFQIYSNFIFLSQPANITNTTLHSVLWLLPVVINWREDLREWKLETKSRDIFITLELAQPYHLYYANNLPFLLLCEVNTCFEIYLLRRNWWLTCQLKDHKLKRIRLVLKEIRLGYVAKEIKGKLHFSILYNETYKAFIAWKSKLKYILFYAS